MPSPLKFAAYGTQALFALVGCVLLWRLVISPAARARRVESPLLPWNAPTTELLFFFLHVLAGGFFGSLVAGSAAKPLGVFGDHATIFGTAGAHLGMLAGVLLFTRTFRGSFALRSAVKVNVFTSGIVAFLISLPVIMAVGLLWTGLMELVGLPVERQMAVEIFKRTKSPLWLLVMATTAVIVAPATEELVFRAGLFRFLRTRVPRWAALLLPACLFAAMHVDLPTYGQLAALGVVFALAYERTGHIGTVIVAHAIFNLNMLLLLLSGAAR